MTDFYLQVTCTYNTLKTISYAFKWLHQCFTSLTSANHSLFLSAQFLMLFQDEMRLDEVFSINPSANVI